MKEHISPVKITRPRVSGVLLRRKLFGRLSEARQKPVIWVSAPGGAGKTTLAASYLDSIKLPSIWYQVDQGDSDPATFFYYMGLAAQKAVPQKNRAKQEKQKLLPLLTPERLLDVRAFTRRYFERLYGLIKPPFAIVLDNYQEVPEEPVFQEIIETGLSMAPEGINIIVLSRRGLPARFSRLYANGQIAAFGWNDLKFTGSETKEMFCKEKLPDQYIESLHSKTDGWIAGMVLLNENLKNSGKIESLKSIGPSEDLFNYFAVEVFEKTDGETRGFLLKTSFLPQIEPLTAEKLTGLPHADRLLSRLSGEHFFTTKHPGSDAVYQYHPLFREFLQSKARETFSHGELREIKTKAAGLLADSARIEDGVDLFFQSGDFDQIERLILENAQFLARQGRTETVRKWLEYLPAPQAERNPVLMYWKGIALSAVNPMESRDQFKKAFTAFREKNERTWMFLAWSEAVAISFHCSEYSDIAAWLNIIREILEEDPSFPSAEIETRVMLNIFNSLTVNVPEGFDIDAFSDRAFNLLFSGESIDIALKIMTGNHLTVFFLWKGDLARAGIIINFFEGLLAKEKESVPDLFLMSMLAVKALYEFFCGDCDTCIETAVHALKLSAQNGVHIWDDHLLGNAAAAALSKGDMKAAASVLADMSGNFGKMMRLNQAFYYFLKSWESALSEDIEGAYSYQQLSNELMPKTGYLPPIAAVHIALAELLHFKGDSSGAEREFEAGKEIATRMKSAYWEFMYFMFKANAAFTSGDEMQGNALLKQAFPLARKHGLANMYGWRPQVMARLCEKALLEGIETEFVQELIRKRVFLFPEKEKTPPETDLWPYPVKIYTLGRFQVLINDSPLEFSGKMQKKPLGILKMLAARGPEGVPEKELLDILWPDVDGDLAQQSFDTTLHRLRKLLKNEKAVFLRDGQLGLDRRHVWVDLWSFEALCSGADGQPMGGQPLNGVSPLENALKIYKGKFLPLDALEAWAVSRQEKLDHLLFNLVMALGNVYEQEEKFEKAAAIYRKGIELNDAAEEFYQKLMLCFYRLGQRTEAIMVYNRCRSRLAAVLNIRPSSKTESIYASLLEKDNRA